MDVLRACLGCGEPTPHRRCPECQRDVDRRIADIPAATFIDDQLGHVNLSAWEAARRGFILSLASPDELAQRIAAVQAEMQRRQGEADGAFAKAVRQRYGMGDVA